VETIDQMSHRPATRHAGIFGHWPLALRIAHPMRITVKTPSPSARGRKRKHVTEKKTSRDATEPN
jgi:hypothetical protein